MDSIARLPHGIDALPLELRSGPYLLLPPHLVTDRRKTETRDAGYRAILPENARNSRGGQYKQKFLRRYAFDALVKRARCERQQLFEKGEHDKAMLWNRQIEVARQAYTEDGLRRRDLFFRAIEPRRGSQAHRSSFSQRKGNGKGNGPRVERKRKRQVPEATHSVGASSSRAAPQEEEEEELCLQVALYESLWPTPMKGSDVVIELD